MALSVRFHFQHHRESTHRIAHTLPVAKIDRGIAQGKNPIRIVEQLLPRAFIMKLNVLQEAGSQAHRLAIPAWPAGKKLNFVARIISLLEKQF